MAILIGCKAAYHRESMNSLLRRLHNPGGRECGCSADCFCQTTLLGRALRWYTPGRWHKGPTADEKRARAQRYGQTS